MSLPMTDKLVIMAQNGKIYLVNTDYNKIVIVYYPVKGRYAFYGDFGLSVEELAYFEGYCAEYLTNTKESE